MRTILIVEDDLNLLEGLEIFFEMEGFRTYAASNGRKGIELAREHHPDIVLTNFQMPGADGLEVIQEIRRDETIRETPVIFISANSTPSLRELAIRNGASTCLAKPFSTDILMERIDELLYGQVNQ